MSDETKTQAGGNDWPIMGRGRRAGEPPTDIQRKAIDFVRSMESGPVGDASTRAEIETEAPGITLDELNDCLVAGWLRLMWWGIIGGEPSGEPDCWVTGDPLPGVRESEEADVAAWEAQHAAYETWKVTGENGPCPLCGAITGAMHGTKYCFGMNALPVGVSSGGNDR